MLNDSFDRPARHPNLYVLIHLIGVTALVIGAWMLVQSPSDLAERSLRQGHSAVMGK